MTKQWKKFATVGAKAGTDITDSAGNVLDNEDIRNDDLSINYSGTNIQIKKGNTQIGSNTASPDALKNAQITTKADGTLNYDGTVAVTPSVASIGGTLPEARGGTGLTSAGNAIVNSRIQMNTNGTLNYTNSGSGAVSKAGLSLDYTDGATVGAVIGTNMFDTNGSTALGADDLKNGSIGLAADGSLTNIGTTQKVSNSKIASTDLSGTGKVFSSLPASGATVGATWGTNVGSQPDDDDILNSGTITGTLGSNTNTAVNIANTVARLGSITNAGAWDGSTIATDKGGTGATNLNAVQNSRITTAADGTLLYNNTTAVAPNLGNITGIVGKTSGGFGEDVASKSGAVSFSSGTISYGTLPASIGGTGLTSTSTLLNSNVTTYEVNSAGFSGAWTNISGQIDPPAASFAITITWRNGAGSSLGTSVVTVSRNSNSTALLAATVASGGAHDSISLGAAANSGVIQTTTVTKNSVPVVLTASLLDGSGWGFK